jgi:hypothetical protein
MKHLQRLPLTLLLSSLALAPLAHARGDAGSCHYTPVAELPITLAGPSLVPVIDGAIDGTPARMHVSINSSFNWIPPASAEKRGLPLLLTGRPSGGVGGGSRLYTTRLKDFAVGPFHSGKVDMRVIGDMTYQSSFDAVVGADFLMQTDLEMALTSKLLKFYRADGCADTFLAYWDKDAMEIPFDRSSERQRNPRFTVNVNGKPMSAVLSTGYARSTINVDAAARAGVRTDSAGVTHVRAIGGVGTDLAERWEASFTTFSLGSETIQNANMDIVATPSTGHVAADVILGLDFLRAHRVLFAMSQNRLYISYLGGDVFAKPLPPIAAAPAQPGSH